MLKMSIYTTIYTFYKILRKVGNCNTMILSRSITVNGKEMANRLQQIPPGGGEEMRGVLPYWTLMRVCRWMGSQVTTGLTIMGSHFQ